MEVTFLRGDLIGLSPLRITHAAPITLPTHKRQADQPGFQGSLPPFPGPSQVENTAEVCRLGG